MVTYPKLRARYSNGTLKLSRKLRLKEGTEVYVTLRPANGKTRKKRKVRALTKSRKTFSSPTVYLPPGTLNSLSGIISLGGDALADSEALYDGD
ncbi:MAG: DUF104 domain-containing protein [Chloroflexota bacterium]|nr:MAG: DUF104 domain-containing protein [Chloroflexota bacterium]